MNNINSEMLVDIALCTHKKPKDILVVDLSHDLEEFLNSLAINYISTTLQDITSIDSNSFDVVIIGGYCDGQSIFAEINRVLKDDGVFVVPSLAFDDNKDDVITQLTNIGNEFLIAMPYRVENSLNILGSKKYHPTADIILQRSDLLDSRYYYSTEIHLASFVLPKYMEQALLGINKR